MAAGDALIARFLAQPGRAPHQAAVPEVLGVLTARERGVLAQVAAGPSNEEIAGALCLSPHTVKTRVNRAMAKLNAHDRAQLVVLAYETGPVRPGHRDQGG